MYVAASIDDERHRPHHLSFTTVPTATALPPSCLRHWRHAGRDDHRGGHIHCSHHDVVWLAITSAVHVTAVGEKGCVVHFNAGERSIALWLGLLCTHAGLHIPAPHPRSTVRRVCVKFDLPTVLAGPPTHGSRLRQTAQHSSQASSAPRKLPACANPSSTTPPPPAASCLPAFHNRGCPARWQASQAKPAPADGSPASLRARKSHPS